jgi:hypothetical protein
MRYLPTMLATALAIALGVAAVVYGEADDAPGLQLLGMLLAAGALAFCARTVRHIRQRR